MRNSTNFLALKLQIGIQICVDLPRSQSEASRAEPVPLGHISNIIKAIGIIGNIGKTALIGHHSMGCQQFIYT